MGEVTVRSLAPRARLAAIAAACAACAACATAGTSSAPPTGPDGVGLCPGSVLDSLQVADVDITDTTTSSQWVVQPLKLGVAPYYPPDARLGSIEADVVASFIVDTAGRVVPRSSAIDRASAWVKGPLRTAGPSAQEFSRAVCEWVSRQRYAPVHLKSGGPPVRARITTPMKFRLGSPD